MPADASDFIDGKSFFFFKQKTAYEVRISDWSSDVCSSDLLAGAVIALHHDAAIMCKARQDRERGVRIKHIGRIDIGYALVRLRKGGDFQIDVDPECLPGVHDLVEIGRASCRERVCQYV